MTKEEFISVIKLHILPLFTGSFISGETDSTSRDSEVAQGTAGTVLLKAHKSDEYRIILKRTQPFKGNDVNLLKAIINELVDISELNLHDENYKRHLQATAIEKAICKSISEVASETLLGIIIEISNWGNRTYEGRRLNLGIILNEVNKVSEQNDACHYSKFLNKGFFSLLSDGENSYVEIDRDGFLLSHVFLDKVRASTTYAPNEFEKIARYCGAQKIGICLSDSGDILLFKNHELLFARRSGSWNIYCHEEIIQLLSNRTSHTIKDIRRAVYFTALDVSFSNNGGCLVYINKDNIESVLNHIHAHDILDERYFEIKKEHELREAEKLYNLNHRKEILERYNKSYKEFLEGEDCAKSVCLINIIQNKKFNELSRKLREEIVSMDGATIIDYDGTIVSAGAIVKIEAGSESGGRLAATKTLAKYGVAIKISMDGIMQGISYDKKSNKEKMIFSVG